MSNENEEFPSVIELNVGGVPYTTSLSTLKRDSASLLGLMFTGKEPTIKDAKGRYFIDRDGVLFRYVLDYLRNQKLILPKNFHKWERLKNEADFFNLKDMLVCIDKSTKSLASLDKISSLSSPSFGQPGCLTIGYRGSFAFDRDGLDNVNFRKLHRILVCGRVTLCREVFRNTLDESRDQDRYRSNENRYTARLFLEHNCLEQAFDNLQEAGFKCVAAAASGTCDGNAPLKLGTNVEKSRWNHYNEFVFTRP